MYPIKRRRLDSPSSYATRENFSRSLSRGNYDLYPPNASNLSVRGPALATTRVQPRLDQYTVSSHRPRSLYHDHDRREDLERVVRAELEYSRHFRQADSPRRRDQSPSVSSSSPSQSSELPGLATLLNPRSISSESRVREGHEADRAAPFHHRYPAYTEDASPTQRHPVVSSRRLSSPARETSSESTPTPDSLTYRDSVESAASEAEPIHPIHRDHLRMLSRAESISSTESGTPIGSEAAPSPSSFPFARTLAKSSRYLREIDRRNILQRIQNGEKQATLAKEYQVSRAAICNLNKHREVVLSRKDENPLAKHPKKPRPKGLPTKVNITSKAPELSNNTAVAYEIKTRSVTLLLTLLRSHQTTIPDFRRYAERVMRLIVEEALALVPLRSVHANLNDTAKIEGVEIEHLNCAVALGVTGGLHFLRVFRVLEPHQLTGSIRLRGPDREVHLPRDMRNHNVFLFDLFTYSSESVCTAISMVLDRGGGEGRIWIVSLCVSYEVADYVHSRFPLVKIVTAQMDRGSISVANGSDIKVTSSPPAIAKPDVLTKVLLKRFLEAYEPRRSATQSTASPTEQTV